MCFTINCSLKEDCVLKLSPSLLLLQSRYVAADRGVRLYSSLPMRPNPDGKRLPSTGVRLISSSLLFPPHPYTPTPTYIYLFA